MARYEVQRIMFYANGLPESNENSCFAFTYLHGDTRETAIFQCHVFRCDIPEAVSFLTNLKVRNFGFENACKEVVELRFLMPCV